MEQRKPLYETHVQTILLSIVTAGLLGLFGFLWSINGTVIAMKVQMDYKNAELEKQNTKLNEIQMDIKTLDNRVRTLEVKKNGQ